MKKLIIFAGIVALAFSSCTQADNKAGKLNLRLKWAYQAQFTGYLVAKDKGFYKDAGLDVNIQPAGPDLKPYSTVASGSDDVGIGIISQVLSARSNQVPLVAIAQVFQDSPNRFVLKSKNKINSLSALKGKKVGLWMGGDEIEFISMLKTAGMTLNDVQVVPQKFSIAPFLEDAYVCSQVMVYNELNQIQDQGIKQDNLQILSPKDYHSAILGDMIFTNEAFLKDHPDLLKKFLAASFKGWDYARTHQDEAIQIVKKYNPELETIQQKEQLTSILSIIFTKDTKGFGHIDLENYKNTKQILLNGLSPSDEAYKKLQGLDVTKAFDNHLLPQ